MKNPVLRYTKARNACKRLLIALCQSEGYNLFAQSVRAVQIFLSLGLASRKEGRDTWPKGVRKWVFMRCWWFWRNLAGSSTISLKTSEKGKKIIGLLFAKVSRLFLQFWKFEASPPPLAAVPGGVLAHSLCYFFSRLFPNALKICFDYLRNDDGYII